MKDRRHFVFGVLKSKPSLLDFWLFLEKSGKKLGFLEKDYELIAQQSRIASEEIAESILEESTSLRGLSLYGEENEEPGQFFSYLPGKDRFAFAFREADESLLPKLTALFAEEFSITNAVSNRSSYSLKFHSHFNPPNTELTIAPGCHNLKNNHIQGVSAEMWFGDEFWKYAACNKRDFLAFDWLEIQEHSNHIYAKSWDHPFDSNEGEQGKTQMNLLKLLYNIK